MINNRDITLCRNILLNLYHNKQVRKCMSSVPILACLLPYLIFYKPSWKKCIAHDMHISIFSPIFELIEIVHLEWYTSYGSKIAYRCSYIVICYCYPILIIIGVYLQILLQCNNMWTDKQMEILKLVNKFLEYLGENAPNMYIKRVTDTGQFCLS
jgi:hypothetical protein